MNTRRCLVIIFLAAASYSVATVPPADVVYPQIVLEPQEPSEGDSVVLRYIVGMNNTTCVPHYATSFTVDTHTIYCFTTPCPQQYVINVSSTVLESAVAPIYCGQAFTPYGPVFRFGMLPYGNYTVVDSTDTLISFAVRERAGALNGTVAEDCGPLDIFKPVGNALVLLQKSALPGGLLRREAASGMIPLTTIDSARTGSDGRFGFKGVPFDEYTVTVSAHGFQTRYTAVALKTDTNITVSLRPVGAIARLTGTVLDSGVTTLGVAARPVAGCSVTVSVFISDYGLIFSTATDSLGRFGFDSLPLEYYDQAYVHLTAPGYTPLNTAVPLEYGVTGTVTLRIARSGTTALVPGPSQQRRHSRAAAWASYSDHTGVLTIRLDRPQTIRMHLTMLDGRSAREFTRERQLDAGTHRIDTRDARRGAGMMLLRITGQGLDCSFRIGDASKQDRR